MPRQTAVNHPRAFRADDVLVPGRLYACHTVEESQPWSYETHLHVDCCDLTYVYRGSLEQRVNGTKTVLLEGEMMLVRSGDVHRPRSRGVVMYNLNFRPGELESAGAYLGLPELVDALMSADTAPVFLVPPAGRSRLLLELQHLLYGQKDPRAGVFFRGFLARWLADVANRAAGPVTSVRSAMPAWMSNLLRVIEDDVEQPVSVSTLARLSGKSGEHIARCFRHHLNTTPSAAINDARIRRAALLLAHTNREILDIAYGLGFNSPSYFYRLFRAAHGASPRRYRLASTPLRSAT